MAKSNGKAARTAAKKISKMDKVTRVLLVVLILVLITAMVLGFFVFKDEISNLLKGAGDTGGGGGGGNQTSFTSVLGGAPKESLPPALQEVAAEVHFIDVGQGDSIVMRFEDGLDILVDGGAGNVASKQTKENYINHLKTLNIDAFDYMLVTHQDSDHINLLSEVLDEFEVKNIYHNPALLPISATFNTFKQKADAEMAGGKKANVVEIPKEGKTYNWHGESSDYRLDVYAPGVNFAQQTEGDVSHHKNAVSPIVVMEVASRRVVLTGDAENDTEEWFISKVGGTELKADVLKIGHHGSKISTTTEFLNFLKPDYAVISVGDPNTHGHPTADNMNRLFAHDVATYRTNRHGNIALYIDKSGEFGFLVDNELPLDNNKSEKTTRMLIKQEV